MPSERIWISETTQHSDQSVRVSGWVRRIRDHGKLIFFDLADRSGMVQIVLGDAAPIEARALAKKLSNEAVVTLVGRVVSRSSETKNLGIQTGAVEIVVETIELLNAAGMLPFEIDTEDFQVNEESRLKYRYLDLRRPGMYRTLKLRSDLMHSLREALHTTGFVEIETPMLTKSTKEGARDFIVPSRFQPGKFYALPQSPQQYKQLLMTAGVERYYQVARCIRDEDLRADRGFEFTQLDLEMSYVTQSDVMETVEQAVIQAVLAVGGKLQSTPFPVVDYADSMARYGADRFDLRSDAEKADGTMAFAWVVKFPFFKRVDKGDAAEVRDGKSGYTFTHNPFSAPLPEHSPWHLAKEHIEEILTSQYDLVCNGYEVGGGSIRAHLAEALQATFEIMGYSHEEIERSVGHMLEAFRLGTPPHGGIALGLDRLVMLLAGRTSLKDVIAFPMSSTGRTSVMDAPSPVEESQLLELGLALRSSQNRSVFSDIKVQLDGQKIPYRIMEHAAVRTSGEAAAVRGTSLRSGAKALLIKADNAFHMVVISAADKLDSGKLRDVLGAKKTRFASAEEVESITGCKPGGVPPFGHLFGIKLWVDKRLSGEAMIDFNAGEVTQSIELKYEDYANLVKPTLVEVSVHP